ncbi:MAG: heme exporter protein CcmB [Sphingomonadales bacterium]
MSLFIHLIKRDLVRSIAGGGLILPVTFFLLVATLYPFAVGPDAGLLGQTGGGMLWVAALLAALLPVDRLVTPDAESGVFDQLAMRGISEEAIVGAKLIAHWIGFAIPLMIAAVPASALLRLDMHVLVKLEIGLLLGTPGLAALGMLVASLTAGLKGASALSGLLMLPLAIPVLIFGAGSLAPVDGGALKLLAAASLLLVAITPFAGGAAIRAGRE